MRHYLDANATEPLRPEAAATLTAALAHAGNPASVHADGRAARRLLEDAREAIAALFGAAPAGVVFTSGATEANALALHACGAGRRLLLGATEHDSVLAAAPAAPRLPVDRQGRADMDALAAFLADGGPAFVALMAANNETGTLQPLAEAAALCRRHGAWLHVDAVQAAGRVPLDLAVLGAHSLAVSAHKLGGPMGAGALLLGPEAPAPRPLLPGGGQERGWRAGTPPLPAIAGFAAAARAALAIAPATAARLCALRTRIEQAALAAGAEICGAGASRLANTTCLALPGVRADAQVIALDLEGIAVSAGAACSSGKVAASHVLAAMGLGPRAGEAIRVSLPWNASEVDAAAFAAAYPRIAARLRASLPPAAPASAAA
jgi:cysteine desulfurase